MKEKLFKFLFPDKYNRLKSFEDTIYSDYPIYKLQEEVKRLNKMINEKNIVEPINFAEVDDTAKPKHFLADLTPEKRKNAIARLETIYQDDWFIKAKNYAINVLGNYSFQVEPDVNKMQQGRFAVIGIKTLMKEFENAHTEFIDSRKKDEEFDPLALLPE